MDKIGGCLGQWKLVLVMKIYKSHLTSEIDCCRIQQRCLRLLRDIVLCFVVTFHLISEVVEINILVFPYVQKFIISYH